MPPQTEENRKHEVFVYLGWAIFSIRQLKSTSKVAQETLRAMVSNHYEAMYNKEFGNTYGAISKNLNRGGMSVPTHHLSAWCNRLLERINSAFTYESIVAHKGQSMAKAFITVSSDENLVDEFNQSWVKIFPIGHKSRDNIDLRDQLRKQIKSKPFIERNCGRVAGASDATSLRGHLKTHGTSGRGGLTTHEVCKFRVQKGEK